MHFLLLKKHLCLLLRFKKNICAYASSFILFMVKKRMLQGTHFESPTPHDHTLPLHLFTIAYHAIA
jgi:hypothetical protein